MRRFVIGDIHGCMKSLRTLLETIAPQPDDELICLGDYIDRGPDSRDVVDQLIEIRDRCRLVALRGNHEIMLLGAVAGLDPTHWLGCGGLATLTSYGGTMDRIPQEHLSFFLSLKPFHETEKEIFVHACYDATRPMDEQSDEVMYWKHLGPFFPPPHSSGKRVFVGHTPQPRGDVLDLGHLVCLDTYCFGRGYLSALDLDSYDLIQIDYHGHPRRVNGSELTSWLSDKWNRISNRFRRAKSVDKSGRDGEQIPESPAPPQAGNSGENEVSANQEISG